MCCALQLKIVQLKSAVWIIQSNQDIVSRRTYCWSFIICMLSLLWATQIKFLPHPSIGTGMDAEVSSVLDPKLFKAIPSSASSLSTSFVASRCKWLFLFSTSKHKSLHPKRFQFCITHKSSRIMSVLSSMFDSRGRTLTICSILFDALCFKSYSLHRRSKQWTSQDTQVWHTLSLCISGSVFHGARENSDHCADSTHQTNSTRREYTVWVMCKVWLKDEIILRTFCYVHCFFTLYFSSSLPWVAIDYNSFVFSHCRALSTEVKGLQRQQAVLWLTIAFWVAFN